MGVDKYTFIGPYIKILGKLDISVIKVKRVCPKHPEMNQDGKFCKECGTLIENVEYTVNEKINFYDLLKSDNLYTPPYLNDVLLGNYNVPEGQIMVDDDTTEIDLTDISELIKTQKEWFIKEYYIEIDILNKTFGEDNIKICWGLVTYWM